MSDEPCEGWNWLLNGRKYHYFVNHASLCGNWLLPGPNKDHENNTEEEKLDTCNACWKKLQALRAGLGREHYDQCGLCGEGDLCDAGRAIVNHGVVGDAVRRGPQRRRSKSPTAIN